MMQEKQLTIRVGKKYYRKRLDRLDFIFRNASIHDP